MNNLQVRVVEDYNEFLSLQEKWDALVDSMEYPIPVITHSWIRIWVESFGDINSLYIITVWDDEKLVGILYLYKTTCRVLKIFKFRCLKSLAGDFSNIICRLHDLEPVLDTIKTYLAKNSNSWSLIALIKIPIDFGTIEKIIKKFSYNNICVFAQPENGSYYINIKGEFEDYFRSLNKSFSDNRKNINNRLSRNGKVEFKVTDTDDKGALNLFYDLENMGWKRTGGISVKLDPERMKFCNDIATIFSQKKQFLLSTLYMDGEPIASIYGLLFKETFYFLNIGINYSYPECRKISPGQAILYHLIKYCFDQKIKRFDFYGPCYPYEAHWTKTINRKYNITIFNCKKHTVKICVVLRRAKDFLKIIFSKLNLIRQHEMVTQQTKH